MYLLYLFSKYSQHCNGKRAPSFSNLNEKDLLMTSYDAWRKFDVDAELARVDERLQQEAQLRSKQRVEDAASAVAAQDAQVLAAHAAVAALKAKKANARAQQQQPPPQATEEDGKGVVNSDTSLTPLSHQEALVAAELRRHAELFSAKHALVTRIMERRREGDRVLKAAERDAPRALRAFEDALASAKELEALAPQLLAAEKARRGEAATATAGKRGQEEEGDDSDCQRTHGNSPALSHEHVCSGHQCTQHTHTGGGGGLSAIPKPAKLPTATDLLALLTMFFKDVYVGIGTCHVHMNRLAAASEAFKEVLLRDELHVPAWLERGRAFEHMGASLLAMLHFSRASTLVRLSW